MKPIIGVSAAAILLISNHCMADDPAELFSGAAIAAVMKKREQARLEAEKKQIEEEKRRRADSDEPLGMVFVKPPGEPPPFLPPESGNPDSMWLDGSPRKSR
jgi:hypothetical protein